MSRHSGKRRYSARHVLPLLLPFAVLFMFAPIGNGGKQREGGGDVSVDGGGDGGEGGRYLDCKNTQRLGDAYGGWVLCQPMREEGLAGGLVYTVGVGRNIEWDRAMIERYGTEHHGWDPTPTAKDFVSKAELPGEFHFHAVGLASEDGNLTLKLPESNGDSFTVMEFEERAQEGMIVDVPVWRLRSMMASLNHTWLAILKVDIEGGEFDVISRWGVEGQRVAADQVLIEFHERYFRHWSNWTKLVPDAVSTMDELGFRLVHRTRLECSFARKEAIARG